jgi:hypothetical protein
MLHMPSSALNNSLYRAMRNTGFRKHLQAKASIAPLTCLPAGFGNLLQFINASRHLADAKMTFLSSCYHLHPETGIVQP